MNKKHLFASLLISLLSACNTGTINNTSKTDDTSNKIINQNDYFFIADNLNNIIQDSPSEENIHYDNILPINNPEMSIVELNHEQNTQRQNLIGNTYTYVRCYYSINSTKDIDLSNIDPKTNYVWARNHDGSYYKLFGYWRNASTFAFGNMFFTSMNLKHIREICNNTLQYNYRSQYTSFDQVAANNRFSFNHTVWQNDVQNNNSSINKIISFGDSLSDTNNMFNMSLWLVPNRNSWFQGRFSNGRTWVEYLSMKMDVPLYNWAIGGAKSNDYIIIPGLEAQANSWANYMRSAINYDPSRTLFTVLIGGNDLLDSNRNYTDIANEVYKTITILAANGAKHVLLLNLPDITRSPRFNMVSNLPEIPEHITKYNDEIPKLVQTIQESYPNINIMIFDTNSAFNDILNRSGLYGFENTTDTCLRIDPKYATNYFIRQYPRYECKDASKYIFWDALHPTTATHYALANLIYPFLINNLK